MQRLLPARLAALRPYVRHKAVSPPRKEELILPYIGDIGLGMVQHLERMDSRAQAMWEQSPAYEDEEDSPQYFADHHPPDLIFRVDVASAGKTKWPLIPEVDARQLSNKDWNEPSRKRKNEEYCRKHGLDLVFPDLQFAVNLNVRYSDMYWHSVFFGNYLTPVEAQQPPVVNIGKDPTSEIPADSLFTLMMFTPDYPFRTNPEEGHLLHWMICNLSMGDATNGDVVVDYLPPLPTEYAGHFRYIFALFRQEAGRIALPAPGSGTHYSLEHRRNFFLHAIRGGSAPEDANIMAVQPHLPSAPCAVTFCHSSYDIEVTEYYQRNRLKEPIYTPDSVAKTLLMHQKYTERDAFTTFHKKPEWSRIWPSDLPQL